MIASLDLLSWNHVFKGFPELLTWDTPEYKIINLLFPSRSREVGQLCFQPAFTENVSVTTKGCNTAMPKKKEME